MQVDNGRRLRGEIKLNNGENKQPGRLKEQSF